MSIPCSKENGSHHPSDWSLQLVPETLSSCTFDVLPVTHPQTCFELAHAAAILYVQKEILKDVVISCAGPCFSGDLKPSLRLFLGGLQTLTSYGLSSRMRYTKTYICTEWKNVSLKTVFESTCLCCKGSFDA